jgi:hypothetical protein
MRMSKLSRKLVAVLMLLWLPLSSGSALAASIAMQLQHGGCVESAEMQTMSHDGMDGHHQHHEQAPASDTQASCDSCGVCHLACTGYLAVPAVELVVTQTTALESTPYLVSFHSRTAAPLVPPPLVRA